MSNVVVKCPKCSTVVQGKTGLFVHTITCPNCNEKLDPKKAGTVLVTCSYCGENVAVDTTKPGTDECPNCHAPLGEYRVKNIEIECPNCHMHEMVKHNEAVHMCPMCGMSFDVQREKAKKASKANTAAVITVPFNNENVIWLHPETTFPYASQVVVPEGYTALILRNGRCVAPSHPGNYILSDSLKSLDDQLKDAVFNPTDQVSVQIIFVKNIIDANVAWARTAVQVTDRSGNIAGTLAFGGGTKLSVIDAKKLASFVGFRNASAEDLVGPGQALKEKVGDICFKATFKVLRSAINQGYEYNNIDADRPFFEDDIQRLVNDGLEEVGLITRAFSLEHIFFHEDARVRLARKISAFIEKPISWSSKEITLTKDSTRYTNVTFGGDIKFRLKDQNVFFGRSEIKEWISRAEEADRESAGMRQNTYAFTGYPNKNEEVSEAEIKDYFSNLATTAANGVLSTRVQSEIKATSADIRDLSKLYQHVEGTILVLIQDFFNGYGLEVEQFTFDEIARKDSDILEKEKLAEIHKESKTIDLTTHQFDNLVDVESHASDTNKTVSIDDIDVKKETHLTQNSWERTKNRIEEMKQRKEIEKASDFMNRESELRKEDWADEDEEKEHKRSLKRHQYSQEENTALHYVNTALIEERAEEIRRKWEEDSNLEYDRLLHAIRISDTRDDARDRRTLKNRQTSYRVSQGDAENDRIINGILRKIAESDLELREKTEAYERILRNSVEDDKLSHYIEETAAKIRLLFEDGHIKNLLTEEENKILADAKERELERLEKAKEAEFMRTLSLQELAVGHEMEKFKMEYDADRREQESLIELNAKALEIEKLRMILNHYQNLDENDVSRFGIREMANSIRAKAENEFKSEVERSERAAAEKREREQHEREERYSQRADELLTRMLSIQEAMKKLGFENERLFIQEQGSVARERAKAEAAKNSDMEKLIEELKDIAKGINIRNDSGKEKSAKTGDSPDGIKVVPMPEHPRQAETARTCPHCGTTLPQYSKIVCPFCKERLY